MVIEIHDLEQLQTLPNTRPLVRFKDNYDMRWYSHPEDQQNPERWYASVTSVISIAVHERLKNYLSNTAPEVQKTRLEKSVVSGKMIHDSIQADLTGKPWVASNALLVKVMGNWQALKTAHKITADQCEVSVYSPLWGFAGTIDVLGTYDGKPTILDIKTGFYNVKAGFQMGAYRAALSELTKEERAMVGLGVKADGSDAKSFEYSHFDWCILTFHSLFQSWKGMYYSRLSARKWNYLHTTPLSLINFTFQTEVEN